MDETWKHFLLGFSFLLGAAVGSFLNVCIWRLPREGLTVGRPRRSFCPTCGSAIGWRDNIPLVSWALLGGRCRACRAPISVRYIAVEGLTAVLFLLVARRWLFVGDMSAGACVSLMVLMAALVVASFIDLELQIIPDEITVRGMTVVPFLALLVSDLQGPQARSRVRGALSFLGEKLSAAAGWVPAWLGRGPGLFLAAASVGAGLFVLGFLAYSRYWRSAFPGIPCRLEGKVLSGSLAGATGGMVACNVLNPELLESARVHSFWSVVWGMLVGSGLVFAVGLVGSKVFRKPAMGFGDVKLMGLLGAFTGWVGAIEGFFAACLLGSVVGVFVLIRHRTRYLPFGPFLALGSAILLLWPGTFESVLSWYLGLFSGT